MSKISRRKFLYDSLKILSGMCVANYGLDLLPSDFQIIKDAWGMSNDNFSDLIQNAHPARFWISVNSAGSHCKLCHEETNNNKSYVHKKNIVRCLLCAKECIINEGERGKCRARINIDGELKSLVYGHLVSIHIDPIEKKPFYHFLPGSSAFSMATTGCPLSCKFCQNWEISQASPEDYKTKYIAPESIISETGKQKIPIIAFTYNEPTIFTEYLTDVARLGRKKNYRSVLISCGFMNKEPLDEMCDVLDAIKIDLKGFDNSFYQNVCSAELDPVLKSIKHISKRKVHLEIVNLVVPTLNDSKQMLSELSKWVMGELGPDVPIHFTRFHPDYQMLNLPPTPVATLEMAYDIAKNAGIRYPFVGNVPDHPGNNTYCPKCTKPIIIRNGFFVTSNHIKNNRCSYCSEPITGVWS